MNESSKNADTCSLPMAHGIAPITINAIVCVLGSLGNLFVCLAIDTNSRLRRASNYLLFSLAIADLIVTLICEPLALEIISHMTFFHECTSSLKLLAYGILGSLSCTISVLHLVAISIDRFVAVVFPLRHKLFLKKCGIKIMLIISWSIKLLLPVLFYSTSVSLTSSSGLFIAFGILAFSCLSIFFFHFLIVAFLLHRRKIRKQLGARTVSVKPASRMEVCVTCTLAIATGVFVICWTPLTTAFASSKPLINWNGPLHMWLQTLALSNSAMNFMIYSARMRYFKDAYIVIARKMLSL